MKIIIAAFLYIISFLIIITALFTDNINHAILDVVLSFFLTYIAREFFEKEAK